MPGPNVTPFRSDPSLPSRVDVVIIGGGIIGASTALELADRGVSVLLCEKGQIGAEQSSRNWGWVRLSMRDPREIPLMLAAQTLWAGLDARLERKTGYTRSGILYTSATEAALARREAWTAHLSPYGVDHRMVRGADLDHLLPGHALKVSGALYTPLDGRAEPQWATSAIAEGARDRGATIVTGCAVRSLDMAAGRVAGVITERGRVACDVAVLAGGAWSRLFAGNAGIRLPQLKVLGTVMRTTPVAAGPDIAVWSKGAALRKRADGGYAISAGASNIVDIVPDSLRLGPRFLRAFLSERGAIQFRLSRRWFEEAGQPRRWSGGDRTVFETTRILDPDPAKKALRSGWAQGRKAFPALEQAEVVQSWGGLMDVTPDAIPVISPAEDKPGLLIATGFSGHGFGIAPGAGHLAADLITGDTPIVDPAAFRLSRFSDGSRLLLADALPAPPVNA